MASESFFNTIRIRWRDLVSVPQSLPTGYDNDFNFQIPESDRWARFIIDIFSTTLIEISAYRVRHLGVVSVQLFDNLGAGDKGLLSLYDIIEPNFRNQTTDGIVWRQPDLTRVGQSGKWYQVNVDLPFEFDEFHS